MSLLSYRLVLFVCISVLTMHFFSCNQPHTDIDNPAPCVPIPTPQQFTWQQYELTMFVHFTVNTFTDLEWGDGTEDPDIFNPTQLDCRQWVRTAKEAGFKLMILTAKHHDGFCLWPSDYTDHSVQSSKWRDGKGDVVGEFVRACREYDMKVGFYLSPWDRHEESYGTPAYNEYFKNQLTELLTEYGPVHEVWFDGARKGEGTPYDWQGFYGIVRKYAPQAVIAIMGPDVRWVGNEKGVAPETNWSTWSTVFNVYSDREKDRMPWTMWYPTEVDVSIRRGWFWHADQEPKSLEKLTEIYFQSVGRNSVLLLNVPPNDKGLFPAKDVKRLQEFKARIDSIFHTNLALNKQASVDNVREPSVHFSANRILDGDPTTFWAAGEEMFNGTFEINLGRPTEFNVSCLQEPISLGQRVRKYEIQAEINNDWQTIVKGTTIGYKKLDRFPTIKTQNLRLFIQDARSQPLISELGLYYDARY